MRPVWVIGAGGHAKVVIDALRASGSDVIAGVLDDNPRLWGSEFQGVTVAGGVSAESVERLAVRRAIVAVGDNRHRAEVVCRLASLLEWASVIHPRAYVAQGARIGPGSVVVSGVVVQPDAIVGDHVILNTSCSVDHDVVIGDFAHVGPGARLTGHVRVGEGAFLGAGSVVTPSRVVGAWATVGAGGVVVRDIPDGATAKGVPAAF